MTHSLLRRFDEFVTKNFASEPTHLGDAYSLPWWYPAVKDFLRTALGELIVELQAIQTKHHEGDSEYHYNEGINDCIAIIRKSLEDEKAS